MHSFVKHSIWMLILLLSVESIQGCTALELRECRVEQLEETREKDFAELLPQGAVDQLNEHAAGSGDGNASQLLKKLSNFKSDSSKKYISLVNPFEDLGLSGGAEIILPPHAFFIKNSIPFYSLYHQFLFYD